MTLKVNLGTSKYKPTTFGSGKKYGNYLVDSPTPYKANVLEASTVLQFDIITYDASVPLYQVLLDFIDTISFGDIVES